MTLTEAIVLARKVDPGLAELSDDQLEVVLLVFGVVAQKLTEAIVVGHATARQLTGSEENIELVFAALRAGTLSVQQQATETGEAGELLRPSGQRPASLSEIVSLSTGLQAYNTERLMQRGRELQEMVQTNVLSPIFGKPNNEVN